MGSANIQIKVREDTTSLSVLECKQEHNGYYECKIVNDLGEDKTRASLTVSRVTEADKEAIEKQRQAALKRDQEKDAQLEAAKTVKKPALKKVDKKKPTEQPKPEKVQLKKPKVVDKPKEQPSEGVRLKPTPPKAPKEEDKKDTIKLKPVPPKEKEKAPMGETHPRAAMP